MTDTQSKWIFHVGNFVLHVDFIALYFQENVVFISGDQLDLIIFNEFVEFVAQKRGKCSSVSCTYD